MIEKLPEDHRYKSIYERTIELGLNDMAKELAEKYLDCLNQVYKETNTIWENHAPEAVTPGSMSGPDFCGW